MSLQENADYITRNNRAMLWIEDNKQLCASWPVTSFYAFKRLALT